MKLKKITVFLMLLALASSTLSSADRPNTNNSSYFSRLLRGCVGLATGAISGAALGVAAVPLHAYLKRQIANCNVKERIIYGLLLESLLVASLAKTTDFIAQQANIPHSRWLSHAIAQIAYRYQNIVT